MLNSIQTSFLNERMLDLIEAPAQTGRAFNSAILTGPNRVSVALAPKKVGCAFPRGRVSDFVPECVTRFALWSFAEAPCIGGARGNAWRRINGSDDRSCRRAEVLWN